jgi:hypothetical protein
MGACPLAGQNPVTTFEYARNAQRMEPNMSAPLKNVSTEDLEKALAAALLAVAGKTVSVSIKELVFDETTNRVDITLSAWNKLSNDPFATAI